MTLLMSRYAPRSGRTHIEANGAILPRALADGSRRTPAPRYDRRGEQHSSLRRSHIIAAGEPQVFLECGEALETRDRGETRSISSNAQAAVRADRECADRARPSL